jgi:DNA-binding CsgD family transcriptional regulator
LGRCFSIELLSSTSHGQATPQPKTGARAHGADEATTAQPLRGATLVVDDERCCREASLGACRILGASRAEVEGRDIAALFEPATRERLVHFWAGFAEAGGSAGPFRITGVDAPRDVSLTLTPNVVPGRHVVGIQAANPHGESARTLRPGARVPSAREREILGLLAEGETDVQIAAHLKLSPATVQTHVRNAKAKLGARTRAQAVALALTSGLIPA